MCTLICAGCGDDAAPETTAGTVTGAGATTGDTTTGDTGVGSGGSPGGGVDATGAGGGDSTGSTGGGVCTADEKFCNGSTLFTCKPDGSELESVTCDNGCADGACKTGCTPGESKCKDDDKTLVICSDDGKSTQGECPLGCEDGACLVVCEADEILCDAGGNKLVRCAPDGLSAQTFDVCPYGCTDGEKDCNDAACDEKETRCVEDDGLYVEVCNEAQTAWLKADSPCKEECKDGNCIVSACDEGESQCGQLGVEICNADKTGFENAELCKSGCIVTDDGPVCAQCKEGLVECNGNIVQECKDPLTGFVAIDTCSRLQACAGGECLDVVVLDKTTKYANHLLLFKAFLDCFQGELEGKCRAIDTTAINYDITFDTVKDWWCDNEEALVNSFSVADYDTADDLAGQCGFFEIPNETDFDFETDIFAGQSSQVCLGFTTSDGVVNFNNKEVVIKPCDQF